MTPLACFVYVCACPIVMCYIRFSFVYFSLFFHVIVPLWAVADGSGLFFHVVGEGVVRLLKNGRQHISDRENYIDFRMRLLGEPGKIYQHVNLRVSQS